jgi:hypothetical protein
LADLVLASGGKNNANTKGAGDKNGMATYTITKDGAMFEASVGGQNFNHASILREKANFSKYPLFTKHIHFLFRQI